MSEYTMYHNAHCSKSRETLRILTERKIEPRIINYIENGLCEVELKELISSLNVDSSSLVRNKDQAFIDSPFDLNDKSELILGLISTPKLLQRPIVIKANEAIICRPPEKVFDLIK